jgi:hypothetical protein
MPESLRKSWRHCCTRRRGCDDLNDRQHCGQSAPAQRWGRKSISFECIRPISWRVYDQIPRRVGRERIASSLASEARPNHRHHRRARPARAWLGPAARTSRRQRIRAPTACARSYTRTKRTQSFHGNQTAKRPARWTGDAMRTAISSSR